VRVSTLQQVDNSIIHTHMGLVAKLKRVQRRSHLWSKVGQNQSLQNLHDM